MPVPYFCWYITLALIECTTQPVIYDLIDTVETTLHSRGPAVVETSIGRADVLKVFELRGKLKGTVIAGCSITEGKIRQGELVQVMRPAEDGELVSVGRARLETLNLHDTQVQELSEVGTECGIKLDGVRITVSYNFCISLGSL